MISFFRWSLLIGACVSLLQATVLFGLFQRWLFEPWARMNERLGDQIPPFMRDRLFQRGWPLLMTVVCSLLDWATGTAAGYVWLQRSVHQ